MRSSPSTALPEPMRPPSKPEDRQHHCQGSGAGRQHHAEAHVHNPHAHLGSRRGGGFPLATQIGEKTLTRSRALIEDLVAAIPIDANRRGDQKRARRPPQAGQQRRKGTGGIETAGGHFAAVRGSPAAGGKVGPREMNGRVEALDRPGVGDGDRGGWIPLQLRRGLRNTANQLGNPG